MPDQLLHLNLRGARRVLTLAPLALLLVGAWFSVRWYIGDTIAEYANGEGRGVAIARQAVLMAPDDPLAHWKLADLEQNQLPPDQLGQAINEFEQAAKLSPNDYRFWLPLGRALEQAGNIQRGEQAMRRAVDLAPAYAYPRWYLGNLLLRSGRNEEAFAEFRRASEADPQLRPQVFTLTWEVYSQNPDEIRNALGTSSQVRAQFAQYLLDRKLFDEGLRVWNDLNATDKQANRDTGEAIMTSLLAEKRFHQALGIWNAIAPDGATKGTPEQVNDGDFERIQSPASAGPFGWHWKSTQQAQVTFDSSKTHSGAHSLRLQFQARAALSLDVTQLIVVEPNTQYDIEFSSKTFELASAGTPIVEVINGLDNKVLGSSQPAPSGNNDWQKSVVSFHTGANTEGIIVRFNRASCGDNAVCPIFGNVWYDDFSLKRH